jgi:hypothetical protein
MSRSSRTVIRLKGNYFAIANDVIDKHGRTIGAIGVGVYAALARFADAQTGECWPAIARLERVLGLARSTVKFYLRKLEDAGLIEIEERWAEPGDRTSNLYKLLNANPSAVAGRLAARAAVNSTAESVQTPELHVGGSVVSPPSTDPQPTGGFAADPYQFQPEQNQANNDECSRTAEKPATPAKAACPHPEPEVTRFDGMILCHHCWSMLDESAVVAVSAEGHTPSDGTRCVPAA